MVQIGLASFSPGSFSCFSEAVEGGDGDSRLFKFNARTRRGICDLFLGLLGVVQIGLASFSPGSFTCFSEAAEGGMVTLDCSNSMLELVEVQVSVTFS